MATGQYVFWEVIVKLKIYLFLLFLFCHVSFGIAAGTVITTATRITGTTFANGPSEQRDVVSLRLDWTSDASGNASGTISSTGMSMVLW